MPADFDLDAFLPYRLNRAAEFVSKRFAAGYKARYNMTRPEWRTLALLGARPGMTATEIGRHSSMHKTKVSRAVYALETRGWLVRRGDKDDRRVERLELTEAGRRAFEELVAMARDAEAELDALVGVDSVRALMTGLDGLEAEMARTLDDPLDQGDPDA
jgi:DNA-binding MarR family transcriptional regulator